ncbi:FecR family protein [Pseudomonas sp. No.21]|uniref:FecR domain-containing protein n=1 Tax=Pseudomonas TaxID=286 RepID=UPI000DA99BD2|nr:MULTISPECIES: FecR family protein [Pseudomonas]MDW3711357.1 FecR family protein [Pseudomonas sp. 2023EL-01195]PZE10329.1 iron dicitrate transport regulator FecR [Pseudomonas sp. 57B-090624]GJN50118.1 sigma factor regulator FemR [Pseudomonas tohonis]
MNRIDPQILGEAADWLVQLHSGSATEDDHRAIQQWRNRSPQHAQAWTRAESILGDFRNLPGNLALQTLDRAARKGLGRRQAIARLGMLLLAAPVAWTAWRQLPWQDWSADLRTATGEQKDLHLPDGSRLLLNTASALDVAFTATSRRLRLFSGEVLITTARDPSPTPRPFLVETPQGVAQALGTRFALRLDGARCRVAVMEGAVRISNAGRGDSQVIEAGRQSAFERDLLLPSAPLDPAASAWETGMLLAQDMRLAELVGELGRYRPGVLRCHPGIADLRVSGAFPLRDTDASLRLLQDTLPVTLTRLTRYWVTLEPTTPA